MNTTKKIEILNHALEYIIDAHEKALAKCEDTLGMYYHDNEYQETIQETETLVSEINYLIIGLRLEEESEGDFGGAMEKELGGKLDG